MGKWRGWRGRYPNPRWWYLGRSGNHGPSYPCLSAPPTRPPTDHTTRVIYIEYRVAYKEFADWIKATVESRCPGILIILWPLKPLERGRNRPTYLLKVVEHFQNSTVVHDRVKPMDRTRRIWDTERQTSAYVRQLTRQIALWTPRIPKQKLEGLSHQTAYWGSWK
ncbi:hypothetical protein MKW94_005236 [Papaver nudicaule]|uniref:Uncharacterized protein n=1 Tax=Papaver nudicaule TaxID=74823 RepID=A0AA41VYY0_PAPNU|nr:hypothetical protein [Papaver nudicaule]